MSACPGMRGVGRRAEFARVSGLRSPVCSINTVQHEERLFDPPGLCKMCLQVM